MIDVESLLSKPDGWHERRRKTLGGSDANILMNGDPAAILRLWEEKLGRTESEDLSDVLPVQLGSWTEPLNLYWFGRSTGREVSRQNEYSVHPVYPFMACELDGASVTTSGEVAIVECKHVNQFSKIDEVAQKYMPQCHHAMAVTGLNHCILSVFIGTFTHEIVEIECDDWYLAQLIDRERAFWACVESGEPPHQMEPVAAPAAPETLRTVDMEGNNAWASSAADWLDNRDASKAFTAADKAIKKLMEDDMGHAFGHGLQCKRAKNGSLRITEMKQ